MQSSVIRRSEVNIFEFHSLTQWITHQMFVGDMDEMFLEEKHEIRRLRRKSILRLKQLRSEFS